MHIAGPLTQASVKAATLRLPGVHRQREAGARTPARAGAVWRRALFVSPLLTFECPHVFRCLRAVCHARRRPSHACAGLNHSEELRKINNNESEE